jgi:hypothetical protein
MQTYARCLDLSIHAQSGRRGKEKATHTGKASIVCVYVCDDDVNCVYLIAMSEWFSCY